jgi:AcrR family transcriptional regulator
LQGKPFEGLPCQQVVSRSGAPVGSVYYHFPGGKNQLADEALRIHGEKARRLLESAFAQRESLSNSGCAPFSERPQRRFRNTVRKKAAQSAPWSSIWMPTMKHYAAHATRS